MISTNSLHISWHFHLSHFISYWIKRWEKEYDFWNSISIPLSMNPLNSPLFQIECFLEIVWYFMKFICYIIYYVQAKENLDIFQTMGGMVSGFHQTTKRGIIHYPEHLIIIKQRLWPHLYFHLKTTTCQCEKSLPSQNLGWKFLIKWLESIMSTIVFHIDTPILHKKLSKHF